MGNTVEGARADTAPAPRIVEVHGLRGLALVLVVGFHLFGDGRVSGGVDVFLVVSGFLATMVLLRRVEGDGLRLTDHYGRVLARLVPSALVVLAATAVAGVLLLPSGRWIGLGHEVVASALFFQNVELVDAHLGYEAAAPETSPLQHFWSLSVQAQFLLVLPLVVAALAALLGRRTRRPRVAVGALLAAVTAGSFAYALQQVEVHQARAYFDTLTRLWELGVGGLLGLVVHRVRLADPVRAALAWTGLALVVSAGFVIDGGTAYPGLPTWWPVGGALLVLVGAGSAARWSPQRVLRLRPLTWLADVSYELYLWHWPLLVLFLFVARRDDVGWPGAAAILAISLLLAWATRQAVSQPVTRVRAARGARPVLAATAVATLVVVAACQAGVASLEREREQELAALKDLDPQHPGAAVLEPGYDGPSTFSAPYLPSLFVAAEDLGPSARTECIARRPREGAAGGVPVCESHLPDEPTATVVLVGASHVYQWESAFVAIAAEQDWQVRLIGKGGCRLQVRPDGPDNACAQWSAAAMETLLATRPDAVVVEATRTPAPEEGAQTERMVRSQVQAWRALARAGIPVLALRDNPRPAGDLLECIDRHGPDPDRCSVRRAEALADPMPVVRHVPRDVHLIDLTPQICPTEVCPLTVGNVLVYRNDHLTDTYVRTLAPTLDQRLRAAAPWLYPEAVEQRPADVARAGRGSMTG